MAYPRKFLRLVISGSLYDVETFSYSMALIDPSGDAQPPSVVPPALISAVQAFHAASPPSVSSAAKLETIKLNQIGLDGKYTSPTTVYHEFGSPIPGIGTTLMPAQVALAVSLTTPIKRGRAHAGRFYVPVPGILPITWGGWSAPNMNACLTNTKTFLNAVNTALDPHKLCVMSNIGAGTFQIVTGVRIGGVLDTIRSRRAKIPEQYVSATLA